MVGGWADLVSYGTRDVLHTGIRPTGLRGAIHELRGTILRGTGQLGYVPFLFAQMAFLSISADVASLGLIWRAVSRSVPLVHGRCSILISSTYLCHQGFWDKYGDLWSFECVCIPRAL